MSEATTASARKTITISLSEDTLVKADRRAADEGRTRSNYIAWLVEQDVRRAELEASADSL